MENKKSYKARVEIGIVVEIDVDASDAANEKMAEAWAEYYAGDIVSELVCHVDEYEGGRTCNRGVRCTDI